MRLAQLARQETFPADMLCFWQSLHGRANTIMGCAAHPAPSCSRSHNKGARTGACRPDRTVVDDLPDCPCKFVMPVDPEVALRALLHRSCSARFGNTAAKAVWEIISGGSIMPVGTCSGTPLTRPGRRRSRNSSIPHAGVCPAVKVMPEPELAVRRLCLIGKLK